MKWDSIRLGDVMEVKHGYAFDGTYFADAGEYVLLTPGNCHESGGLKLKGDKEKYFAGEFPPEFLLNEGDMLVVMTDLINRAPILGGSFLIPEGSKYLHNQRLGLVQVTDEKRIDRTFLYYLLNTHEYRGQVRGSASGATVRHTSPGRIKACRVRIPADVSYQSRVGAALAAYDDLIENNRRRMKLLEDAARLLYQDWFVRLRFPGHERVRVKDGMLEGWNAGILGDIVDVKKGKNITRESVNEGTVPVVAGGLSPAYYHDSFNAVGPVITISASGANSGYVNLYHEDIWASDCSYITKDSTDCLYCLYLLLKSKQAEIFGMQKGAAQPHVYPKDLVRLPVTIAPPRITGLFEEAVEPMFMQVENLLLQNRQLCAARDLLLPRLMSGELRAKDAA
ncbi:MAG: restriction endonuclease subunit S [candidate division WOR-3 bacterium]|nr:restriction endonuclease subunit S [candidate division WOR-3 bacterium]